MEHLVDFEKQVIRLLARSVLSEEQLDALIREAEVLSLDHTGVGYFLLLAHASLPAKRVVCDQPALQGIAGNITCGFVIFIEDGNLTLECYTWGPVDVPEDFRSRDVRIELARMG